MVELDIKRVRAILHDWGGLARMGHIPDMLMHGFPSRNVIDRMRQDSGPPGRTDGVALTPPEAAVDGMEAWKKRVVTVDTLIAGLPPKVRYTVHAFYAGKKDARTIAQLMSTAAEPVLWQRVYEWKRRAEEAVMRALQVQVEEHPEPA